MLKRSLRDDKAKEARLQVKVKVEDEVKDEAKVVTRQDEEPRARGNVKSTMYKVKCTM